MKKELTTIEIYLLNKKSINIKFLNNQKYYKRKSLSVKDKLIKEYFNLLEQLKDGNLQDIFKLSNDLKEIDIKLKNGIRIDFLVKS